MREGGEILITFNEVETHFACAWMNKESQRCFIAPGCVCVCQTHR